jgi:hypothetical protein
MRDVCGLANKAAHHEAHPMSDAASLLSSGESRQRRRALIPNLFESIRKQARLPRYLRAR